MVVVSARRALCGEWRVTSDELQMPLRGKGKPRMNADTRG